MTNRFFGYAIAALLACASVLSGVAIAQVPSISPPYNAPVPAPTITSPTAVVTVTNTLRAVGTHDSNFIDNLAYNGVVCNFNQTAESGSPNVVLSIMVLDAASGTLIEWAQAPASNLMPGPNNRTGVMIYPAVSETIAIASLNVQALKLPRFFKVRQTITGSGNAATTGTVGCELLK